MSSNPNWDEITVAELIVETWVKILKNMEIFFIQLLEYTADLSHKNESCKRKKGMVSLLSLSLIMMSFREKHKNTVCFW